MLYALKIQKKAGALTGVDPSALPVSASIESTLRDFGATTDDQTTGALLFAIVDEARRAGIDPETALRAAAVNYRDAARSAELGGRAGL